MENLVNIQVLKVPKASWVTQLLPKLTQLEVLSVGSAQAAGTSSTTAKLMNR